MNNFDMNRKILEGFFYFNSDTDVGMMEDMISNLREQIDRYEKSLIKRKSSLYGKDEISYLEKLRLVHSNVLAVYQQLSTFPASLQTVWLIQKPDENGRLTSEYLQEPVKMVINNVESKVINGTVIITTYTLMSYEDVFKKKINSDECKKCMVKQKDINKSVFASLKDAGLMLRVKDFIDTDKNAEYDSIGHFLRVIMEQKLEAVIHCLNPLDFKEKVVVRIQGNILPSPFYAITDMKVENINTAKILHGDRKNRDERAVIIECRTANEISNDNELMTLEELVNKLVEFHQAGKITKDIKLVFDDGTCTWLKTFNSIYDIYDMSEHEADTDFVNRYGRSLIQIGTM